MRGLLNLRPLTSSVVLAIAVGGLAAAVPPAAAEIAETVYVAEGGSDTGNDCSSAAAPCATVSRALTQVGKGATVRVSGSIVDHVEVHGDKDPLLITGVGASAPAVLRAHESSEVVSNFGDLTLQHLEITGGHLAGNAGGAISNTGGELALSHVVVRGNTADKGGGVYNDNDGVVTIEDSQVVDNLATGLGGGGGLYSRNGAITVRRTLIADNTASGGGGGGIAKISSDVADGTVVVEDSTISGNSAVDGGGLLVTGGLTLARSTVSENQATFGGGIWNSLGTSWVVGSTVAGNVSVAGVGGIHNNHGHVELASTIVGLQTGAGCGGNGGIFVSAGHNIDAGTGCGLAGTGDQSGTDPQLGPLQDNGGVTATLLPAAAGPAVDRIPVGTAFYAYPMCGRHDQRGVPGPVAGATGCSVGAVEPAAFVLEDQAPLAVATLSGPVTTPLALASTGGSGDGRVTFTAADGSASGCSVSGTPPYTLSAEGVGTCTVTAHKAAWGTYRSVSSAPASVALTRVEQAPVTVTSTSGTFGTPLPLTSGGGTGAGAVTFAAANGTATGCQVGGTAPYQLSSTTAGTCTVTATKAGDELRLPASSAPTTVTIARAAQAALLVTSTSGRYGTPLVLTTSGGSGSGAVTYEVSDGTADCELVGPGESRLQADAPGSCAVTATKAADGSYAEAGSPTVLVVFGLGLQEPLVLTSTTGTFGEALPLTTSGGSGSGAVTFTVVDGTADWCEVSEDPPYALRVVTAGTCEVTATKAADSRYEETSATATVTFPRAAQDPLVVTSTQGTYGAPLTLETSGGSGSGAVSYAVANGTASGCAVDGSSLKASTAGTCLVTATKAGSSVFEPVSSASTTVTFVASAQAPLVVTTTRGTYGAALTLATSGGSGPGAVSYTVGNGTAACTLRGATLTVSTAGTCRVTATKAGGLGLAPVSSVPTTVTFTAGRPGKVRALKVAGKAGAARRSVSWGAPASTGGLPITRYVVTVTKGAKKVSTTTTRARKVTLKRARLPRGRLTVTVVARTAAGTGPVVKKVFTVRR